MRIRAARFDHPALRYRTRYRLIIQNWAHLNVRWLEKTCGPGFRATGTEHLPDGPAERA